MELALGIIGAVLAIGAGGWLIYLICQIPKFRAFETKSRYDFDRLTAPMRPDINRRQPPPSPEEG
ncbi:MAG TPA: hypothetical protein VK694_07850 [Verrucomicrobiae bacterium]|nr:hypothetical protein [Verrucomicrobiae bacterium]